MEQLTIQQTKTKERQTLEFACCLRLAEITASYFGKPGQDYTNEIYWHVRESCNQLARDRGIFWGEVISAYGKIWNYLDFSDKKVTEEMQLRAITKDIWSDIIDPRVEQAVAQRALIIFAMRLHHRNRYTVDKMKFKISGL